MSTKIKIFFSYSSQDKVHLKLLKTLIKSVDNNDLIEYFDYVERNENSSKSNYETIYDNITSCNLFVAILTPNYLKSTLCCWEAGLAFRENLLEKRKANFTKIAMLTDTKEPLELFHLFNNHYKFNKTDLSKLIKDLQNKYSDFKVSRYRISNNLDNLKKETESILITKIIERKNFNVSESEKIRKLIE